MRQARNDAALVGNVSSLTVSASFTVFLRPLLPDGDLPRIEERFELDLDDPLV